MFTKLSQRKPRIISLYTELTSLKKMDEESVTDYMIRAETVPTSLKTAGETISDSLLVAMVLKGLPLKFKPFSTVITQKDKAQQVMGPARFHCATLLSCQD